ncbi:FecR family protein [Variovorax sp.]|jgi:transmembrane sensor|uniref:FecR family protein n=1 Tax=Variovorax sp. TaxID=1871043 RepID=UPI0012240695|nr:FecR domain-containing protein [Variovorax sp.]TAJ59094.1 MAG: iron dicitrate transport regulator FecR [Variovorax sp.]
MAARAQPLLGADERRAPRALVEHALTLIGRIHRGSPEAADAAQAELGRWRALSPANADAAATAHRIWNAVDDGALRGQLPMPPSAAQERRARRRTIGLLGVAGLAALAGAGGRWYWQQPVYEAMPSTGQAQTLAHALPDGSTLDLAANTALRVLLYRDRRTVHLARGEARFAVARDAERPFTVSTDWGRVRVLGTVFTVSVREGRMRLAVAEGRVAVWGAGQDEAAAPSTVLQAGEAIEADARGLGPRTSVDVGEVADWRQGWLVFRNTRLPEAVARWNDYLRQPLQLADDPALRELRVTGSYRLRDPQAFVGALPVMLPVRTQRLADGGTRIVGHAAGTARRP